MELEVQIREKEFEEIVARRNMTFQELAKKLGISRVYLSHIKSNKLHGFNPSAKLRQKILDILEVEFDDIFRIDQTRHSRKDNAKPRAKRHRARTHSA